MQSLIILAICFYVILAVPVYTCVCFKQPCQPKLCTERECFSCIQNLSQNPCHLCPPYLPTMWYFLPFQVNISCATFKLFKTLLLLICVNVLQLMRKYVVFYLSILSFTSDRLSPGLVAYTSAYPIICKKSWQRGAQPQLITTFINNSLHMFCPDLSVSNLILQQTLLHGM